MKNTNFDVPVSHFSYPITKSVVKKKTQQKTRSHVSLTHRSNDQSYITTYLSYQLYGVYPIVIKIRI